MRNKISVLIADDNVEFCNLLRESLDKNPDIFVVGIAKDGLEAITMIRDMEPDVIVLDIIMPNLDGIGVLERLQPLKPPLKPIIIALTAIGKDIFVQKAIELGADYYIMKPFEVTVLASRIRQLHEEKCEAVRMNASGGYGSRHSQESFMENIVADMIKCMGITPNVAGYRYLREAVMLAIDQPTVLNSASKCIYPVLARNHNTTPKGIDRAIRCALDSAGKKMKNTDQKTSILISNINKPNNTQMIALLAEKAMQKVRQRNM